MSLLDKLVGEYEQIERTELWGLFLSKIKDKRAVESRYCEQNEIVAKHQGAVEALDFILGKGAEHRPLIMRIVDDLQREQTKKEKMIE